MLARMTKIPCISTYIVNSYTPHTHTHIQWFSNFEALSVNSQDKPVANLLKKKQKKNYTNDKRLMEYFLTLTLNILFTLGIVSAISIHHKY